MNRDKGSGGDRLKPRSGDPAPGEPEAAPPPGAAETDCGEEPDAIDLDAVRDRAS